jgi:hypothetical protein
MNPLADSAKQDLLLGIDVGGTTIKYQLFDAKDMSPVGDVKSAPTQRGLAEHTNQIATIVSQSNTEAQKLNAELIGVGIGSPGRFRSDGRIKPDTNTNIEKLEGNEFDDLNLKAAYLKALEDKRLGHLFLEVRNDGDAAMLGVMKRIKSGKVAALKDQHGESVGFNNMKGNHVAYIGIGTGVGHAIMHVDTNGQNMVFKTDGHASKLWMDVPQDDIKKLEAARNWWNEKHEKPEDKIELVIDHENSRVRAEDLLRAPVICGLAEEMVGKDLNVYNPKHKEALEFSGRYLGQLIHVIRSRQNEDVNGQTQGWTEEDKATAALSSDYIIGGGIMKDAPIAKTFVDAAQKELAKLNAPEESKPIRLIAYSGENLAIEAAAGLVSVSGRGRRA